MLEREFEYYIQNQDRLVKKYPGKHLVIIGEEIVGVYDDFEAALSETLKDHEIGTFLIQLCEPGDGSYTQSFHSRVTFA